MELGITQRCWSSRTSTL